MLTTTNNNAEMTLSVEAEYGDGSDGWVWVSAGGGARFWPRMVHETGPSGLPKIVAFI